MTHPSAAQAAAVVADAYAHADLDGLPDPVLSWWTTSVSEAHPGKRFHTSSYCRRLAKIKHPQPTSRRYSEIGTRVCGECLPSARDGDSQRLLGRSTWKALDLADQLTRAAAGFGSDATTKDLDHIERALAHRVTGFAEHHDADQAATAAYNGLRLLLAQTSVSDDAEQALARYAAAKLLARAEKTTPNDGASSDTPPDTDLDLTLLGGSQRRGGGWSAAVLREGYKAFLKVLDDGGTVPEARDAAVAKLLPLRDPYRVEQLPRSMPVPAGSTHVTVADLIALWRTQAADLVEAVLEEWADRVARTLDEHADLGVVAVRLTPSAAQINNWALENELKKFTTIYPSRVQAGARGKTVTVPIVVAAWLERFGRQRGATVDLLPAGDNTPEVLDTVRRLRGDDPAGSGAMPMATALAAARGIVTTAA